MKHIQELKSEVNRITSIEHPLETLANASFRSKIVTEALKVGETKIPKNSINPLNEERCTQNVTMDTHTDVTPKENVNSEGEIFRFTASASSQEEPPKINTERVARLAKMEKILKEMSLKLGDLHDTLDSTQLNSSMYFSKVIEYLDE